MQVDWAGQTMSYVDPNSNKKSLHTSSWLLLPASAYPFVYAYDDTKLP